MSTDIYQKETESTLLLNRATRIRNIKIHKETAELLRIYCILHKRKVTEFTTRILDHQLEDFKKQIERMRKQNRFQRETKYRNCH